MNQKTNSNNNDLQTGHLIIKRNERKRNNNKNRESEGEVQGKCCIGQKRNLKNETRIIITNYYSIINMFCID